MGHSRHGSALDEPAHRVIRAGFARCCVPNFGDTRNSEAPDAAAEPRDATGDRELAAARNAGTARASAQRPDYAHPSSSTTTAFAGPAGRAHAEYWCRATTTATTTAAAAAAATPTTPTAAGVCWLYVRKYGAQTGGTQPIPAWEPGECHGERAAGPANVFAAANTTTPAATATAAATAAAAAGGSYPTAATATTTTAAAATTTTTAAAAAAGAAEPTACCDGSATCVQWWPRRQRRWKHRRRPAEHERERRTRLVRWLGLPGDRRGDGSRGAHGGEHRPRRVRVW